MFLYFLFSLAIFFFGFDYWSEGDWLTISDMRYVTRITESNKFVYVLTTGGILRWDKFSRRWLFPYSWQDILGEERGYEMFVSGSRVYIRTERGYYVTTEPIAPGQRFEQINPPERSNIANSSCPDEFPLYIPPLGFLFAQDGVIIDPNFNRYPVSTCYVDRMNNLWLGSWGLGVWLVDRRTLTMEPKPIGLGEADVRSIFISMSGVWFGGKPYGRESGGITLWDRKADRWSVFDSRFIPDMGTNNVYDIIGNDRLTFFATDLGLLIFDNERSRWKRYSYRDGLMDENLTSLLLLGDTLFIGHRCGLSYLILSSRAIIRVTTPDYPRVNKMTVYKGRVYVATEEGAFWFDGKGLTQLRTPDGYLEFRVYGVDHDSNGLWFVSDRGILFLEPEKNTRLIFPREAFSYDYVNDVLVSERYIWLATNDGVFKIRKGDMRQFKYKRVDGLLSDFVHCVREDGDYVWFGTDSGAVRYLWNKPERYDW